jgi:hypothetical protein
VRAGPVSGAGVRGMNAAGGERMSDAQRGEPRTERGRPPDERRDPRRGDRDRPEPARDDEAWTDRERPAGTDGDEATDHPDGIQIQTE